MASNGSRSWIYNGCLRLFFRSYLVIQQVSYLLAASGVRRIFERGGKKFENNANQKKNFSTQNQFVFLPKIR